jgi:carboxymethylenebutenolidase
MCFEPDSSPPIPAIAGAAVSHEDLTLRSADGTELAAFSAVPDAPNGSGVVILPDVRGLYRFYEELALRFAERGLAAVAIDYFGRTAGVEKRPNDWDFMPHVDQTTHLRSGGAQHVFAVGFCFGGRMAWLAAADGHGLAGAVGFYGKPGERNGRPGPVQRAGEIEAPILALMAGEDQGIGPDEVAGLETALAEAGVEHEVVTYPGAPHSFFDRKQEECAAASDDAWRRTLEFLEQHAS